MIRQKDELETWFTKDGAPGQPDLELQTDRNNNLYINGRKIVTQEVVRLRSLELVALIVTAGGVFVQAVMAVLTYCKGP